MNTTTLTHNDVTGIAQLHASGLGYKRIAKQLGLERDTVRYVVKQGERAWWDLRLAAEANREVKRRLKEAKDAARTLARAPWTKPENANEEAWAWAVRATKGRAQKVQDGTRVGGPRRSRTGLTPRLLYDFVLKGCAVSGLPFVFDNPQSPFAPEVDRIHPGAKGGVYTPDNIQIILRGLNRAKGTAAQDELLSFLAALRS